MIHRIHRLLYKQNIKYTDYYANDTSNVQITTAFTRKEQLATCLDVVPCEPLSSALERP